MIHCGCEQFTCRPHSSWHGAHPPPMKPNQTKVQLKINDLAILGIRSRPHVGDKKRHSWRKTWPKIDHSPFGIRNSKLENRNWKLEIRKSKLETGNSKFEIRNLLNARQQASQKFRFSTFEFPFRISSFEFRVSIFQFPFSNFDFPVSKFGLPVFRSFLIRKSR